MYLLFSSCWDMRMLRRNHTRMYATWRKVYPPTWRWNHPNVSRLPPPASRLPPTRTPPPNGLGPPGIPLYLVFCWYFVALGISTYAMHMLKSNSLPTTYSYIHTYIYIIPYISLISHLAISYACILPINYLHAIYLHSMRYLQKTYVYYIYI